MTTESRQKSDKPETFVERLTAKIEGLESDIQDILDAGEARMADEGKSLTKDERTQISDLEAQIEGLTADKKRAETRAERRSKIEKAQADRDEGSGSGRSQARVKSEPRQYDPKPLGGLGASFLRDSYMVAFPGAAPPLPGETGDPQSRMARHRTEFTRDGFVMPEAMRGVPAPRRFFDSAHVRQTQTSDIGGPAGGLVPEQYPGVVGRHLYAGAPFMAMCNRYDIPVSGMRLSIPRFTAGPGAAQHAEEAQVVDSANTAINVHVPVVTAASRSRVTRALIERGEMAEDYILDMMGMALKTRIDERIINGDGTGNNPKGFIAAARPAGANIDQNATTKTAAKVWQTLGLGIDAVARRRFMAPNAGFISQRRATYLAFALDSAGRPLFQESAIVADNPLGIGRAAPTDAQMPETVFRSAAVPFIVDNNIAENQDTNQDSAMICRREDQHCWGQSMPFMLTWEQIAGETLEVDLVGYEYYAFSSEVQPEGGSNVRGDLFSTSLTVATT